MDIHEAELTSERADCAQILAGLDDEIWESPLIWPDQVIYMLTHLQSAERIGQNIEQGYRYWLAEDNGQPVGYCGAVAERNRLFLPKLFVVPDYRVQGIGKQFINIVERWCRELGLPRVQSTVHKGNNDSIRAYEHLGFSIVDAIETDIGEGFVMDDYVMDKPIETGSQSEEELA